MHINGWIDPGHVVGGFLSLKPGIYSAGEGALRMRDFRYRAIEGNPLVWRWWTGRSAREAGGSAHPSDVTTE